MGISVILLLIITSSVSLVLLFKIFKWVFRKRIRIIGTVFLCVSMIIAISIYKLFFVKMEFVQSRVYPDLYLVKSPVKNQDSVFNAIKENIIKNIEGSSAIKNFRTMTNQTKTLRFYEYSKGDWGEQGTAYFIENQERRDGMTAELLEYYPEFLLAEFSMVPCNEDINRYWGNLSYFNETKKVKTDTLFNACIKN